VPVFDLLHSIQSELSGQKDTNRFYISNPHRISTISFSENSKSLFAGSVDGSIQYWNLDEHDLVYSHQVHNLAVTNIVPIEGSKKLISSSKDGTIKLLDLESGSVNLLFSDRGPILGMDSTKDNRMLVAGGVSRSWMWKFDGECLQQVGGFDYPRITVYDVALSEELHLIAQAVSDNTVWIQDLDNGKVITKLVGHTADVHKVRFSSTGGYLASGAADNHVILWKLKRTPGSGLDVTNQSMYKLNDWITGLDLSNKGTVVIASSIGDELAVWNSGIGRQLTTLSYTNLSGSLDLDIAPDDTRIAIGSSWGTIEILDKLEGFLVGD
jgi:WD40 repeat protein